MRTTLPPEAGLPEPYGSAAPTPVHPPVPLLSDLAGMDEARKWGEALAQDLKDFTAGRLAWSGGRSRLRPSWSAWHRQDDLCPRARRDLRRSARHNLLSDNGKAQMKGISVP